MKLIAALIPLLLSPLSYADWQHTDHVDKLDGTITRSSTTKSLNVLAFPFPYQAKDNRARLTIFSDGTIILGVDKGQFTCAIGGCTIRVKFDSDKATYWPAEPASSGTHDLIFVGNHKAFLRRLKVATSLKIEAAFYGQGMEFIDFNVANLTKK